MSPDSVFLASSSQVGLPWLTNANCRTKPHFVPPRVSLSRIRSLLTVCLRHQNPAGFVYQIDWNYRIADNHSIIEFQY